MELEVLKLKKILLGVLSAHPNEIGCEDCFQHIDAYVELVIAGENASQAYPSVHEHLQRCRNCHEEFSALVASLRACDEIV